MHSGTGQRLQRPRPPLPSHLLPGLGSEGCSAGRVGQESPRPGPSCSFQCPPLGDNGRAHLGWGSEVAQETLCCSLDSLGTLVFFPHPIVHSLLAACKGSTRCGPTQGWAHVVGAGDKLRGPLPVTAALLPSYSAHKAQPEPLPWPRQAVQPPQSAPSLVSLHQGLL